MITSLRATGLNNRDLRLLKHMIVVFTIFIVSWIPIYILLCVDYGRNLSLIVYRSLSVLGALGLLANIMDFFLFNHSLRQYFSQLFTFRVPHFQNTIAHG